MFERTIKFSLENKLLVLLGTMVLAIIGVVSATKIPLDAVPDITNNQVQIVSTAPTLAPQEVEQLITFPLEAAMTNIPDVEEVRSISRYGLSVITIVFDEGVEGMLARQYVQEQLNIASAELAGITKPELMPITTGLGEIYQYVLTVDPAQAHLYDATKLRTIQDWIVKRQLNGTKGVIEVSSFGGNLKQYEVGVNPLLLQNYNFSISDVLNALEKNNQNSGGSYIEKGPHSFYIRTEGKVQSMEEIGQILIGQRNGTPIRIADVANVQEGSSKRYGAMTMDGKGEVVGGITLMLKGANSSEVLSNVKERMEKVATSLPEGIHIYPYLDRSKLIARTISTVEKNLIEGGLIVIFILLLLLGNFRAGLIVASVIPLSMLFALTMMQYFGISANLMSLGAIDFGIVIDGAVIIVEGLLHSLSKSKLGRKLTQQEMDHEVRTSTSKIYRSAAFGVLIILVVFIPILTLEGVEGKTFRPMAQTVGFAIIGSMLLSLTYVPVMSALFLSKKISTKRTFADKVMDKIKSMYLPFIHLSLKRPVAIVGAAVLMFFMSIVIFNQLGAEFVPTLEEGDFAMQQSIKPGSSLNESIHTSSLAERTLLSQFPEVLHVVSKIGTAEVPTDPMAIEDSDVMIILKDKSEWTSASSKDELMAKMKAALAPITWASFEFTQPIQLRFNELMTGSKTDVSVKIFGEDPTLLKQIADEAAVMIREVEGAGDVKVDQTEGLQQLNVVYNRTLLAQMGVSVDDLNQVIRAAYAGEAAGTVYEQERKFDLVVRLDKQFRQELDLSNLYVSNAAGEQVAVNLLAEVAHTEGPMLISREKARRFINIGVNLRNRDVSSVVADVETVLKAKLDLPPGYDIEYGGAFESLQRASSRLLVAVPIALALILLLLYLAFGSAKDTLVIFVAVPLSAVGGILALWTRGMPFSISSGIGFIALFGVSVLNGIVLLSAVKQLSNSDFTSLKALIIEACSTRLRPVIMTASVAALGFLPMALSNGSGAEVQRPLATVVIGGLVSSTLLTLLVLPTMYYLFNRKTWKVTSTAVMVLAIGFLVPQLASSQTFSSYDEVLQYAMDHNPEIANAAYIMDMTALEMHAKVQWDPLAVGLQNGQINYAGIDQFWSISQDVSPLFRFAERSQKKHVVEAKMTSQALFQELLARNVEFQLFESYAKWTAYYHQWSLQQKVLEAYESLEAKVNKQVEVGAIDAIERGLFFGELTAIRTESRQLQQALFDQEQQVRLLAFLPPEAVLMPQSDLLVDEVTPSTPKEHPLIAMEKQQLVLREAETNLLNTQGKQWNLNAGYFNQTLEAQSGFQGFSVGLAIPLDVRMNKVRNKELQIAQQISMNNMEAQTTRLKFEQASLVHQIELLQQSVQEMEVNQLADSTALFEKVSLQYANGEIDFFRFSQTNLRLKTAQKTYFELKKELQIKQYQLNLLTR